MTSVSTKMPYQEVKEISLRSGKSQGNVREIESPKKWPPWSSEFHIEPRVSVMCEKLCPGLQSSKIITETPYSYHIAFGAYRGLSTLTLSGCNYKKLICYQCHPSLHARCLKCDTQSLSKLHILLLLFIMNRVPTSR